ncbi:hypothetical protein E2C01_065442 [Portunus trituberculatus]|uniref:Uncharacterized protein n=1 Tax=Portunus trituberculatus TaxID=210409 RepID=A0A5B7HIU9_PORTR|nr:hypothetical protein [Portunus trituberculatus]
MVLFCYSSLLSPLPGFRYALHYAHLPNCAGLFTSCLVVRQLPIHTCIQTSQTTQKWRQIFVPCRALSAIARVAVRPGHAWGAPLVCSRRREGHAAPLSRVKFRDFPFIISSLLIAPSFFISPNTFFFPSVFLSVCLSVKGYCFFDVFHLLLCFFLFCFCCNGYPSCSLVYCIFLSFVIHTFQRLI